MENRMTKKQNRKFILWGVFSLNIAAFFLGLILFSKANDWLPESSVMYPAMVFLTAIFSLSMFLFLVVLGVMPFLFRAQYNSVATDAQKRKLEAIGFLTLED